VDVPRSYIHVRFLTFSVFRMSYVDTFVFVFFL